MLVEIKCKRNRQILFDNKTHLHYIRIWQTIDNEQQNN